MSTTTKDFLPVSEHFNTLLTNLTPQELELYNSLRHVRVETGFRDRAFIVYRYTEAGPEQLDKLLVTSFRCDHRRGMMMEIFSEAYGYEETISYTPVDPFEYPFFMWLPLHSKLRWDSSDPLSKGSLGFPIVLRTASRMHLREVGKLYCETSPTFYKEFDSEVKATS
jgi:hypothetical protein